MEEILERQVTIKHNTFLHLYVYRTRKNLSFILKYLEHKDINYLDLLADFQFNLKTNVLQVI